MFDVAFEAISAWNQVGLIIGGVICLLIGGVFIADFIYWRITAYKVRGVIKGVRSTVSSQLHQQDQKEEVLFKKENKLENEKEKKTFFEEFKKDPLIGLIALVFASLFFLIPLAFIGFGVFQGHKYFSLKANGTLAQAEVVRNERTYDSESGTSYYAVVRFKDRDGNIQEQQDNISIGNSPSFQRGQKILIYYNLDDPSYFIIDDFWHNMITALGFTAMGSLFLIFVCSGALANKRYSGTEKEWRKQGKIKKQNYAGEIYYSIFEYQLPSGQRLETTAVNGSSSIVSRIPGTKVDLLVKPDDPGDVRKSGFLGLIFGLIFFLPGLLLFYIAFAKFTFGWLSIVFLAGIIAFAGFKFSKIIKPKKQRNIDSFKTLVKEKRHQKVSQAEILSSYEIRKRIEWHDSHGKWGIPISFLLAFAALGFSYYTGMDMLRLTMQGQSAEGSVIRIEKRYNSTLEGRSGYIYYPVVAFYSEEKKERAFLHSKMSKDITYKGIKIEFESKVGSSHSSYKIGDNVNVLYDPQQPHKAIIDEGPFNWLLSAGLLLLGALLFYSSLRNFIKIQARSKMRHF